MEDYKQIFAAVKAHARRYASPSVGIIIAVVGLHAVADRAHAQNKIFDASVMDKWKDCEGFSHCLQGSARFQRTRNGKPQESIHRYKQNRECALAIVPHNRDPLLLLCSLSNPRYFATLDLSKSDPKNAVLHNYKPLPDDMKTFSAFDFVFMEISRHFYYGGTKRLRQAVSDPSFRVTNIVNEMQNGRKLIRVDHIYDYENQDSHVRQHGSLWLDPSRCWCIRRFKSSLEATIRGERMHDTEADVVCETIDHPSGFPILKRVTEHVNIVQYKIKRRVEATSKIDYDLEVNEGVPDSEFTLSAFGLPEPVGFEPPKKPLPWYLWLLIAAAASGAIAFAFRYLARRKHHAIAT